MPYSTTKDPGRDNLRTVGIGLQGSRGLGRAVGCPPRWSDLASCKGRPLGHCRLPVLQGGGATLSHALTSWYRSPFWLAPGHRVAVEVEGESGCEAGTRHPTSPSAKECGPVSWPRLRYRLAGFTLMEGNRLPFSCRCHRRCSSRTMSGLDV